MNQQFYRVKVSKGTEGAMLIALTYKLKENSKIYFIKLHLGPYTIQPPNISISNNRQVNHIEELFILGSTRIMFIGERANEESEISNKVKEIFGSNFVITMEKI